jgi:hypothetical protein
VAHWVLDNPINVGSADRGFRALYGTFGVTGEYERRVWDFRLLVESSSPVRASLPAPPGGGGSWWRGGATW